MTVHAEMSYFRVAPSEQASLRPRYQASLRSRKGSRRSGVRSATCN
jgi:hypothetical protein